MKKPDKRTIWKHNSFHGHAAMGMQNMGAIQDSITATPEAKATAGQIRDLCSTLKSQLATRNDQLEEDLFDGQDS